MGVTVGDGGCKQQRAPPDDKGGRSKNIFYQNVISPLAGVSVQKEGKELAGCALYIKRNTCFRSICSHPQINMYLLESDP